MWFFPVGFQRAFPVSDNTIVHQYIHEFAANKELKVPIEALLSSEAETEIPNKLPKWFDIFLL